LVERVVWDHEVAGSNPVTPTTFDQMFRSYVLQSLKTGRRYVGSCDLGDRVHRHNSAESKATKHGVPWILIRSESFATRREALVRERFYKAGKEREELDKLLRSPRRQVAGSNPVTSIIAQVTGYSYFPSTTDRRGDHPDHRTE
jgi:putative endonuclease